MEALIVRARLDRGVIFTTLYILARLKRRPRSSYLPWHFDPDASYLFILVIFRLARTHIEDVSYRIRSWITAFGEALNRHSSTLPSAQQVSSIEIEVLQYLDLNMDITFALPDFEHFKRYLSARPYILKILQVDLPDKLPLMSPPPKISPSFVHQRPRRQPGQADPSVYPPVHSGQQLVHGSRVSAPNLSARPTPSQW